MPHRSVKRVGSIVFKEFCSLVSSISIFGCFTNCGVDDLCLNGCWLVGTLPVNHNYLEGMIKQYLLVKLAERPLHLRKITSGLALKSVPPIISKRWNRQSMEQIRLKFFMSPPSRWNTNFSKMSPPKTVPISGISRIDEF